MSYLYYKLKITPCFDSSVYRIVEISGNETFDNLSDLILDSFEFDRDHLYMFSLKRKPYDSHGIYHPYVDGDWMEGEKRSADQICLQDVKPVVRNKYLYLYDFGDEWMFYITVMKVGKTDQDLPAKVVEKQGELRQYPNWDEGYWDEEDEAEEYRDEENGEYYACDDLNGLALRFIDEDDEVVKKKLASLPALLQNMWIRLIQEEHVLIEDIEMQLLERLEEAKLVNIRENEIQPYIEVKRGKTDCKEYGIFQNLKERLNLENILLSLSQFYGVFEEDILDDLVRGNFSKSDCSKGMLEDTAEKLGRWDFWLNFTDASGKVYISSFCRSIAEDILQKREKYPVKEYCTLSKEAQEGMVSGDWRDVSPAFYKLFSYLQEEKNWELEDTVGLLEQLEKCVAMGYSEEEYLTYIGEAMKGNGISFTKPMKKRFLDFRNNFPSAALKGYTWGEYEKDRKDGFHQLSLFDKESPFQ